MNSYPHMCRDGHEEIGHRNSESELCPLCQCINELEEAKGVAVERVGGDPELRRVLLREFGTTEPALIASLMAGMRKRTKRERP